MKICIGIPAPSMVHPDFSLDNLPAILNYSKKIKGLEVYLLHKSGVMTSSNRNFILKHCLEQGIDAILWLDTDMLYPPDILEKHINSGKDIIGSVYFKRAEPYDPVVFIKGKNKFKPFQILDVTKLPKDQPFEVEGLGFGGMFVKTKVYKKMGKKDMWMHYGRNFGIPVEMTGQESHDLIFCKTAKKYGFKLFVHSGVQSIHIGEKLVEMKDWQRSPAKNPKNSRIAVIIPSINVERATKTMHQLQEKAGKHADYYIVEDLKRTGFIATINDAVKNLDYDYYVYTAEDAYGGEWWLKYALDEIMDRDAGLLAFNDGKWNGSLAAFGMVEKNWMRGNYKGDLFSKWYKSHYADVELTLMAMRDNKFAYTAEAVLVEVDYKKHGVNIQDKALFNKRKMQLFNSSLQSKFE